MERLFPHPHSRNVTSNWRFKSLSSGETNPQSPALFTIRSTDEQPEYLSRCANGISLRFEASAIVDALVAGGYSEVGLARFVTMTAEGHQYLQMRRTDWRPVSGQATHRASPPPFLHLEKWHSRRRRQASP